MAKKITGPLQTLQLDFDQQPGQGPAPSANAKRWRFIFAMILAFFGLLLFISFTSTLFYGIADQSELELDAMETLAGSDIPVKNLAGLYGARVAHFFLFKTFGISSYLLVPLFFLSAIKIFSRRELISLHHFTWQVLFYTLWGSLLMGYLVYQFQLPHSLGGGIGYFVNEKLQQFIGHLSIFLTLLVGMIFAVLFYQLNPIPQRKVIARPQPGVSGGLELDEEEEDVLREDTEDEASIRPHLPPEKGLEEEEEAIAAQEEIQDLPLMVEEEDLEAAEEKDLDFTYKVADEQDQVDDENPSQDPLDPGAITANDLVEKHGLYDPMMDLPKYQFPSLDLLKEYDQKAQSAQVTLDELKENKEKIVETLQNYNIGIQKIEATIGPTVTLYEIVPKAGVRVSKITSLEDDLALSLAAMGVRIIGQMPGKGTIGIEVANKNREMVPVRTVIGSEKFQKSNYDLPITLGKTISNEIFVADLAKMPHLLMAGATGQGKSVGLNMILASLIYKKHPSTLKFVLVDPKKVELSLFNKLERHFLASLPDSEEAIITDTKKVVNTLNSLCKEMDLRYDLLKEAGCRNIKEYNQKFINRRLNPNEHRFLPYIVLVIDELADLMLTAGKEVEHPIARLAQLARAIGIHLVVATQRPSVNVITGTIKANFPARLSFKVMSKIDSRTILDASGADQLVGMGDMLLSMGSEVIRLQCAFVDTPEVEAICDYIGEQNGYESAYRLPEPDSEEMGGQERGDFDPSNRDPYFDEAARLIVMHQQGSTSLIQRKLKLGYNRAGRLIDQLEAAGIVGAFGGSKAREVLVKDEASLEELLRNL